MDVAGSLQTISSESVPAAVGHQALLACLSPQGQAVWQLADAHPLPALGRDQVLVKNSHAALNPYDWKGVVHIFGVGTKPKVMGQDGSGTVVKRGSGVTRFTKGDRVWLHLYRHGSR